MKKNSFECELGGNEMLPAIAARVVEEHGMLYLFVGQRVMMVTISDTKTGPCMDVTVYPSGYVPLDATEDVYRLVPVPLWDRGLYSD